MVFGADGGNGCIDCADRSPDGNVCSWIKVSCVVDDAAVGGLEDGVATIECLLGGECGDAGPELADEIAVAGKSVGSCLETAGA